MSKDNLFALRPYVVVVDVSVEMLLVSTQVTLCFGPFNSLSLAEKWASEVERLHRDSTMRTDLDSEEILEQTGIAMEDFMRAEIHDVDIMQPEGDTRKPGATIPITNPEQDARDMYLYALFANQEATTYILNLAKRGEP